jgi:transcription initiation factor TFIIIB Brf1 subunit/transcription initiation factor TFIIB
MEKQKRKRRTKEEMYRDMKEDIMFEKFYDRAHELEATLSCEKCKRQPVVHVDHMSYEYLCTSCGHVFEYENISKESLLKIIGDLLINSLNEGETKQFLKDVLLYRGFSKNTIKKFYKFLVNSENEQVEELPVENK